MTGWIGRGVRRGAVLGSVSLVALAMAGGAMAEEAVTIPKNVWDQVLRNQQELMNEVQSLKGQVQNNAQDLQIQAGQTRQINTRIEEVAGEVPDEGTVVNSGKKGVSLEQSGQVNVGVLYADTGSGPAVMSDSDREVWIVDNDNSSSRFRFVASGPVDEYLTLGALIELQIEKNSSAKVDQTGGMDFELSERKIEAIIDHKLYGKLRIGQGDTASNGISEQDLSGTGVVGYSAIQDVGGDLQWRDDPSGALSGFTVDDFFDNLDGLSRKERVRYDTPKFLAGISLATGYIDGGAYDARIQHSYQWPSFGGLNVAAAAGWWDATETGDGEGISGSASILHVPTGLSITGAAGSLIEPEDGATEEPSFYYLKSGWQGNIFSFGKTAVSGDFYMGSDFEDSGTVADESNAYGIQLVQNVRKTSTEFYIGGRFLETKDVTGEDFQDIWTLLSGVRQKF